MKNKTPSFFLLLLLLALFSVAALSAADGSTRKAALGGGGGRLGGWKPIGDTSDPHVLDLGKFAVSEHNKLQAAGASSSSSSMLSFVRVVKAESQVVSGVNYRLVLEAKDRGGRARTYEAVVLEKAWLSSRKLTSFKPL
ncbi:cysteine proteinase inhibitor 1-like [Iris pallida]|uniref:Cysteine proteinase inhibitor 1-like n=1 Tax=Iris pallida TaxID=29817 RepID=A0AAX6F6U6_IRIPA|nr:cysteine proteinase inhibitor 1-like [Iris pallida]